jgi:hypothetical protein
MTRPRRTRAPRWTPREQVIQEICEMVAGTRAWDTPEALTPAQQARVERYVTRHGDWVCRLIGRAIAAGVEIQDEQRRDKSRQGRGEVW